MRALANAYVNGKPSSARGPQTTLHAVSLRQKMQELGLAPLPPRKPPAKPQRKRKALEPEGGWRDPNTALQPFTWLCCVHLWTAPPSDAALSKCPAAQQQQQQRRVQPSRGAKPQGDFANTVRVYTTRAEGSQQAQQRFREWNGGDSRWRAQLLAIG